MGQRKWSSLCGAVFSATGESSAGLAAIIEWTASGGYEDADTTCRAHRRHWPQKPPRLWSISGG
jgi:hypothetical protein